jgi:hypothetical protein
VKPVADAPIHVPFVEVSWLPVCAVPKIDGGEPAAGATVCQSGAESAGPAGLPVVPAVRAEGVCQLLPDPWVTAICAVAVSTSAIESESGDQLGDEAPVATVLAEPPPAGTTSTSEPDENAMVDPSGDHAG